MLAAVDIGNTNVVVGVFDGDLLVAHFRLSTRHSDTSDDYACELDGLFRMAGVARERIDGVCMASVVPPLTDVFTEMVSSYFKAPLVNVGPGVRTGISISYETPRDVGADRVVNAVAGLHRHRTDLIIVDFGTATTFDAVTAQAEYLGGVIVPGVYVSLEALFMRTSKLPKVELSRPDTVIGRNTTHSIQSGAYHGYLAMVEGLVDRMKAELTPPVTVLATGGLATLVCSGSKAIDEVVPHLTLTGLKLIWDKNRPGGG